MRRRTMIRFFAIPVATFVLGLVLGGLWPQTPLHATATDRLDTFIITTGAIDSELEAVYCLDCLTGDLIAGVLGRQPNRFGAIFHYNVLKDLGVDPTKNPKFLMVSGIANLQYGGGRVQPAIGKLYVAEVTSGKMVAYALPWDRSAFNAGQPIAETLRPMAMMPIRKVVARP
ncbi:MAG: hypothetical protein ACOY3P_01235 [Planctomycetota bacterium]